MSPTPESPRIPVLALVNTSEEITRLLEAVFQMEGFRVVSGYTVDIKRGTLDFEQFVRTHQPDAVIWDIAIPYEENWSFFKEVEATPAGQRCRFILTTTNQRALHELVGEVAVREIIGKPWDLDELVGVVRRVIGDNAAARPDELLDRRRGNHA